MFIVFSFYSGKLFCLWQKYKLKTIKARNFAATTVNIYDFV